MTGRLLAAIAVSAAAVPALAGAALLAARLPGDASTPTRGATLDAGPPPPVIFARELCSFSNDDARAALVEGADGGISVVAGGRTWWLFGDTLFLAESGKQIEQNVIAWSDGAGGGACPRLHYYAPNGVAAPFLPKDGSLTAWPSGVRAVDDRTLEFYTAYVYGSGPYAYRIGEVGLARLDTATMTTTVLSRRLWDAASGFPDPVIGAFPVDVDEQGRLRVVLHGERSEKYLARAAPDRLADPAAYEFWDGGAWSPSPAAASPLWPVAWPADPVARLATFENGASIAWNAALGKYVALSNAGFGTLAARTADRLEGPWSAPQPWFDCTLVARPAVPVCYSPFQHPQLSTDNGRTLTVTFTRMATYDTVAYELRLADAVQEYERDGRYRYAAASPGGGWSDRGPAFFASTGALPGFAPVYAWSKGDVVRYRTTSPGDGYQQGELAFYAPPSALVGGSNETYSPIYEWSRGDAWVLSPQPAGLERYGFTRGDIAFYAPESQSMGGRG